MRTDAMRLLISGFEPFGGSDVNPSQLVVEALREQGNRFVRRGVQLHTVVLPVEARRGPSLLLRTLDRVEPDAVVCLGESGRASKITFERVYINLADYRIADNAGVQVRDRPIVRGGPVAYFSTLPIAKLLAAVRKAGVEAETSLSAGAFLCNHVAYALMHRLAIRRRNIPAGFVHLPRLPQQVDGSAPCMPLESMLCAMDAIIRVIHRSHRPMHKR